jgi:ribosomal protein L10
VILIQVVKMLSCVRGSPSWSTSRIPSSLRSYAISVQPPKIMPGKRLPRVFKDKKAFQYNWYSRLLQASSTAPLLILHHHDFTAQRLKKLRLDILTASQKFKPSLAAPGPSIIPTNLVQPTLTVVRTSIFGAALRDVPDINLQEVERMINGQNGGFAVLSLASLNPPQMAAILRAMDRSVPSRPPKTEAEIKQELEAKNADPAQPGRRMKRVRQVRVPELKLMGALIEGRVFLPDNVKVVSNLPSLDTLRAQIVGLLSAPASQLAAVLSEASGGKLARTLEGLKKSLEGSEKDSSA